jgi:PAS domain S-box-containing protein
MPKKNARTSFDFRFRCKAVVEALRKQQEQLDFAIEGSGVGLWDRRFDTGEVSYNDQWARILGYTLEELKAYDMEPWERLTYPEDLERAEAIARRHYAGELPVYESEVRMRHKDGHWVWILTRGKVVERDAQGRPLRMVGTHLDISERKRMETALAESEERLEMAIEGSGVGLWDMHLATGKSVYNEQWARLLGYTKNELEPMGDKAWDLLTHPDDLAMAYRLADRHFAGELPTYSCEIRMRHKDGHWVWILTRGKVVERDDEGRPLRMVGTHLDISGTKRYEEELRKLVAQKENLMKELQHRVKNNLNVIASLLDLQMVRLEEGPSRNALADARSRIRSMASIYERLYSSEDLGSIDLGAYLGDLASSLFYTYAIGSSRVRLERELVDLRLDAGRAVPLGLILNELITNALKYAHPEGRSGTVRVALEERGGPYVLTVSDDGIGLPPGFDPENSDSLGFLLVRALVDQIDGSVRFEGEGGTRVAVEFKA